MIPSIAIIGRETGEGYEAPVSRPMRAAPHSRNHPERRTFAVVAICGQQGFRARAAGLVAPFDETETWARNQEIRLPAIHFQSAVADTGSVIPAVYSPGRLIAGARCVLARHRPFIRSRHFLAPGSRILGLSCALQACKQSARRFANRLQNSILSAVSTGLVAAVERHDSSERKIPNGGNSGARPGNLTARDGNA